MMRFCTLSCIFIAGIFATTVSAQTITGRVVDKRSRPIAGASVSLKVKGTAAQSDADGLFSIQATAIQNPMKSGPATHSMHLQGHNLVFSNATAQNLTVELFDMTGKRTNAVFSRRFDEGMHVLPLSIITGKKTAKGLYIARVTKGAEVRTIAINSLCNASSMSIGAASHSTALAKLLATPDSLIITKTDYTPGVRAVDSDLSQNIGDIELRLVIDPDSIVEVQVEAKLAQMSLEDKIAQTTEVLVNIISPDELKNDKLYGSVFNGGGSPFSDNTKETWATELDKFHDAAAQSPLGIPILYGIDAVHGLGTISGATVFPHNIGMGCTGDTALVARMANITARECRAVGINLNFGPAISVVRNERWGRSYEGYGETPEINALMAAAYIRGLQGYGDLTREDAVAACAKHFIGDGGTTNGTNGGITELSEATITAIHLPPYQAAVREMVASVMPSYNAWNRDGQVFRCTTDKHSLTDILKVGLNWDGFCLSDWDAIPRAAGTGEYTAENVSNAINAGVDMAMISQIYNPTEGNALQLVIDYMASLNSSVPATVSQERLDDAVRRILRIKYRLNLFANAKSNATLRTEFGGTAHRDVARECVRKSLVLIKNEDNALPLVAGEKVVVVGPWAKSLGAQCGGWTISWQGSADNPSIVGTTIFDGLQSIGGSDVTYDESGNDLSQAQKIVLVIGEAPYAETQGDHGYNNKDPESVQDCPQCWDYKNDEMSIYLSDCPHADLLDKCFNSGKPVIVVLLSGRPMVITTELEKSKAFVAAWLPGSEGLGVAQVLYKSGNAGFTGKLTHTWPSSFDQIPVNTGTDYSDEAKGSGGTPLFSYGYGLTY